jgi:hypothetical protein
MIPPTPLLIGFIILVALAFDFTNGFHDSANSISTIVSTKVLTPRQAVMFAAFFNFIAAFAFGAAVASTISKLVKLDYVPVDAIPWIHLAALIGAIGWNVMTWYLGLPTSSSHALTFCKLAPQPSPRPACAPCSRGAAGAARWVCASRTLSRPRGESGECARRIFVGTARSGWRDGAIPLPASIGLILAVIAAFGVLLSVFNLALQGLGAPFAVALSQKLAMEWLYAYTRNPMVLAHSPTQSIATGIDSRIARSLRVRRFPISSLHGTVLLSAHPPKRSRLVVHLDSKLLHVIN